VIVRNSLAAVAVQGHPTGAETVNELVAVPDGSGSFPEIA
jgi:hypothetical protein